MVDFAWAWEYLSGMVKAGKIDPRVFAELATLRAKAEALDRLSALLEDGWKLRRVTRLLSGEGLFRMDGLGGEVVRGPSLVEAINALPMGSEEQE